MAEQLDLTIPITTPTLTFWRVEEIRLRRPSVLLPASVAVVLRGTSGEVLTHLYEGTVAAQLIQVLNTANLTTQSLERRVLARLIADGVLAGTISGRPD